METTFAWAPITKSEEQDDGTMMVFGPAASPDLDRASQRLSPEWLDTAMPAWFAEGANVREQHDVKRAVGVGVGLTKGDGEAHMLAAHIVDPVACLKVKHGVLKGFSVGIKNPKIKLGKADAPGGEVVGGSICEVSVVDRPCNPTTMFEIAKADSADGPLELVEGALVVEKTDAAAFGIPEDVYSKLPDAVRGALTSLAAAGAAVTTEPVTKAEAPAEAGETVITSPSLLLKVEGLPVSEEMLRGLVHARVEERLAELHKAEQGTAKAKKAAAGTAMADGSYPIASKADVRKAIAAVGRGGADHDAIRKHIIKRATALGLEGMVPTDWNANGSVKNAEKADAAVTDDQAAVVTQAEGILRDVRTLVPALVKADDAAEGEEAEGGEGEITDSQTAIACIAKLIVGEAEALAAGDLRKAGQISLLLDAIRSLKWFIRAASSADGDMCLADTTGATKTDTPTEPAAVKPVETPTTSSEAPGAAEALTKADVAELVKSAIAEVSKAQEERFTELQGELTKATQTIEQFSALPVPGGPVLTRTPADAARARNTDADLMRAEAADLKTKADQVADRDLRDGYLERSRELLAKADA
ncbi:hypothetical protein [Streptomyces sp. NBC_00198]|uniref:hypothetical protein n=1 Tax=Streptomyces sp. NBC_00198 TaxID=2975677 RepID=UPI00224D626D|nr:hypothetical protein [Streptomyces sp. NBC_00198]MCX5285686.1 hypothetical protein [Streptomyces sp. NBC_00198]MCX5286212.1 hypothetical protein [Streptomyces sp. NBC_00198]